MSAYFNHDFVSNSDLKSIMHRHEQKREEPSNLQEIFEAGTLNHHALLEPHKADKSHIGYITACNMASTVLQDPMCRQLISMPDFRREHEFYRRNIFGLEGARCKTDGDSRMMDTIFEYKGLKITTENGFDSAIENHDYDQSAFFYLNVVGYKNYLIVGVSKTNTKKLFKRLITREHKWYSTGGAKVERAIQVWKQYGFV